MNDMAKAVPAAHPHPVPMCPRCNTPLYCQPMDSAPFAGAPEGKWYFWYCPGDGCAWEEFTREGHPERWTRDGRLLKD